MSNGLRIVHTESSAGWGGQEIRILSEAEGMIKRGHRVCILAPEDTKLYAEARARNIASFPVAIGNKSIHGVLDVRRWLGVNSVDVINTHSSTDSWLTALACLTLRPSPPIVRTRHISASIPNNWPTRWLYQTATRHIVTTGEALLEQLRQENGFDSVRMTSVPTGIDTSYFVPADKLAVRGRLGLSMDKKLVGCVATLRSWKGHKFLVEAFAAVAGNDAQLVIVGDGPQWENIARQVKELGLSDKVFMPGNQKDVLPWLQVLDIFVLASYANEGVPQALMQAMACGLPVITTPIGSIPEIAKDGKNAIVVPAQDSQAITRALNTLIHDGPLREHLGREARVMACNNFGIDKMLTRMEEVFQSTVSRYGQDVPAGKV